MEQSNVFKKQDPINKSEAVHGDPINAIENVRNLLVSASKSTGEKADAIRLEAVQTLDKLLQKASDLETDILATGKARAHSANQYVQDNPWRMIGATAGISLLIGFLSARRKHQ